MSITTTVPSEFWLIAVNAFWHLLVWVFPLVWLLHRCFNSACMMITKIERMEAQDYKRMITGK